MKEKERVYYMLKEVYGTDEPIILSELTVEDMKTVTLRQEIMKLNEEGLIKRFDTGIYYIPSSSAFFGSSALSIEKVIRKKYLWDGNGCCGYIGGLLFANQMGLTTQVPSVYEVITNRATTDYRETKLSSQRIIIRKPYCRIDDDNASVLQFLDLLKDVDSVSEVEGKELTERLLTYMKRKNISFIDLKPFMGYYPERLYKNMYEVGLLDGVSA